MRRDLIKDEINLADDECCIVFDFGCYFPYSNTDILTFGFSLGAEEIHDYKINHRYPNKYYQTISKRCGRKISKLGYPYVMKLSDQTTTPITMLLCLKVGIIDEQYITAVFPLQTSLTKEKPICGLSLRYYFDKSRFCFTSYEKAENGWHQHNWRNYEAENDIRCDTDILLNAPHRVSDEGYMLLYDNIIELYSSPLLDLIL